MSATIRESILRRLKRLEELVALALSSALGISAPWTDVAAGSTFAPTQAQPYLSCDSTGAVQTTIALVAAPAPGQIQVIRLTGAGKVMPVVVNAQGAGITVESAVTAGTFGASTYLAIADMIVAYKFDATTHQWKLFGLTQGSAQATTQTTWNVSYATGSASGDGVAIPVNSAAEIYRRWQGGVAGTVPAMPSGTITINVLDGTAAFTDPFAVLMNVTGPTTPGGGGGNNTRIIIQSTSTTLVHSGTLTTASAFARTSAGGQITITDAGVADWTAFNPLPLLFVDTTIVGHGVGWLYRPLTSSANGIISPNRAPQTAGTFAVGLVKTVNNGDSYQLLRPVSIYMGDGPVPRVFPVGDNGAAGGVNIYVYRLHLTSQNEFEQMALCNGPDGGGDTFVTLQECVYDAIGIINGVTLLNCWNTNPVGMEATNANGYDLSAGGTWGGLFLQNSAGFIGADYVFDSAAGGFSETISNSRGLQNNVRVGTMSFWGGYTAIPNTSGYTQIRIGGPIIDPVAVFYGKVGGGNPVFIAGANNFFQLTGGAGVAMNFDSTTFTISGFTSGYAFNNATGAYVGPTTFTFPHVDAAIGAGTGFGGFALAPSLGGTGVTTQNG